MNVVDATERLLSEVSASASSKMEALVLLKQAELIMLKHLQAARIEAAEKEAAARAATAPTDDGAAGARAEQKR